VKNRCRKTARPMGRRRQNTMLELLRHARVVTDPKKLASLAAEFVNRKQLKACRCSQNVKSHLSRPVLSISLVTTEDVDPLQSRRRQS
jgi:hypothetical protein